MTNYERITESPEKLAQFLDDLTERCSSGDSWCIGCSLLGYCDNAKTILERLQEECDAASD